MSKQQALLESLLGAAELSGKQSIAGRVRQNIVELNRARQADGYQKLWSAAFEPKRERSKAA